MTISVPTRGVASLLVLALSCVTLADETTAHDWQPQPPARFLDHLRPDRPRLLVDAQGLAQAIARSEKEPYRSWRREIKREADALLKRPVSEYELPDGRRLLSTSKRVVARTYNLAFTYHCERDSRYVDRLWKEMEAVGNFPDWNPSHFLDTGEMAHAVAIAYDWLYDRWTPRQRQFMRDALHRHAFEPGLAAYRGQPYKGSRIWFPSAENNWNQVCNGGLMTAALAVADDMPDVAEEILRGAFASLPRAMREYGPDGGCVEGPAYWLYASRYTALLLAAMRSALGDTFGLDTAPGFEQAARFPIYTLGPVNRFFNFADCLESASSAPSMAWIARHFNQPDTAAWHAALAQPKPLNLIWSEPGDADALRALPLARHFRRAEVVTMRTAWSDARATFVGFKAGMPYYHHAQCDVGSFVLDALGVRWAVDLGADDYNAPGYFDRATGRWWFYRNRAEGHNTLVINPGPDPDQAIQALSPVTRFATANGRSLAVADLTPSYQPHARSVRRGVLLRPTGDVLVQDEISTDAPAEVYWFMHTRARVTLNPDGVIATLKKHGRTLTATLICDRPGARFIVMDAAPLPTSPRAEGQGGNPRVRKLAVHLTDATDARIAVWLVPQNKGLAGLLTQPKIEPLDTWR